MTPARLAAIERGIDDLRLPLSDALVRELLSAIRERDEQVQKLREALDPQYIYDMPKSASENARRVLAATAPEGERDG